MKAVRRTALGLVLSTMAIATSWPLPSCVVFADNTSTARGSAAARQMIWTDRPVEGLDLRYGPGAAARAPRPPFAFVREETGGTAPKFVVTDARGATWIVKLGPEAMAETAATRLVFAAGYFVDEEYYLPRATIRRLPSLSKGQDWVRPGGVVVGARFEPRREQSTRIDDWKWDDNPFVGSRELNGLRVMMALLNNWDARSANNQIVAVRSDRGTYKLFTVSDLGATLGQTGGIGKHSKNDVADYVGSRFITKVDEGVVKFDYDTKPSGLALASIVYPPYFVREFSREKQFDRVPLQHARWIGARLARLSTTQLRDAFMVAGYDRTIADAYVRKLQERIRELTALPQTPNLPAASVVAQRGMN